ncbi:MAG: HIT domain-containing protein [Pseudomonadota bacterium]
MKHLFKTWQLDSTLARDTLPVLDHDLWQTRLVRDRRWPWMMMVPKVAGAEDLDDLPLGVQSTLFQEAARISQTMKAISDPPLLKTNIGALGNVVRQFHLHIVGRREGDPNWPGPIWGFGAAIDYEAGPDDGPDMGEAHRFIQAFQAAHPKI